LVTLAILKTRFDEGHDHLGLFEPFVADAFTSCSSESFLPADICKLVESRGGIVIPADTVRTILGRFVRRNILKQAGGRFLRIRRLDDVGLDSAVSRVRATQAILATTYRSYAQEAGCVLASEDDALSALATFVADNKMPLMLQEPLSAPAAGGASLDPKLIRVTARFVSDRCLDPGELRAALEGLVEGMVLQDALLLRDLAQVGQRFRELLVVIDTPILFALLGLTGVANGVATREGLALLRDAGAQTIAFDRTVAEMRRILAVYEEHLATAAGRLTLHPMASLTRFMLTTGQTPAEVRMISATLERRLSSVGVGVREVPDHDRRYTLDEAALARALIDPTTQDIDTPRIRHDVDCIAGVLTFRRGNRATSFENSRAVFCTTSGRVIRNVQQWYRDQGEGGVPPILHQYALSSLAWLKKPAAAPGVKLHELAAYCVAALRPRPETWEKFVKNLQKLRSDGTLTDDETVAIVASELTEPLLAKMDEDMEPDADTIEEAIERVRAAYRQEADTVAKEAIRGAQREAQLAVEAASQADARRATIEGAMVNRAGEIARSVASACYYTAVAVVGASAFLAIPGVFDAVGGVWKWLARGVVGLALLLGAFTQIHGPSLKELRGRFEAMSARWVRKVLYGVEVVEASGVRQDGRKEGTKE
jgi:hypothetical protein